MKIVKPEQVILYLNEVEITKQDLIDNPFTPTFESIVSIEKIEERFGEGFFLCNDSDDFEFSQVEVVWDTFNDCIGITVTSDSYLNFPIPKNLGDNCHKFYNSTKGIKLISSVLNYLKEGV